MTVPSHDTTHKWSGDGSTTTFAIPTTIKYTSDSWLVIKLREADGTITTWTDGTQYTIVSGDVEVETAPTDYTPASGETLHLERIVPLTQETDYTDNDPFPATPHETALDKLTMIAQQISDGLSGVNPLTVRFDPTVTDSPTLVLTELAADRASKIFVFDSTGATLELATVADGLALLDEDDMVSDSATQGSTQQAIKAYSDNILSNLLDGTSAFTAVDIDGGNITGCTINNNVTGDLTGNVTGDLTGNVAGNVTGDLTGTADAADSLNAIVFSASNASGDSLTTSDGVKASLDLGTVVAGDIFLVNSYILGGSSQALVWNQEIKHESGTSAVYFVETNGTTGVFSQKNADGAGTVSNTMMAFMVVTTGGTLVLSLRGTASVGTVSLAANNAKIGAVQIKDV